MASLDFADVKPSPLSLLTVTLMAIVGIVLLKWVNARWPLPFGVGAVINAV